MKKVLTAILLFDLMAGLLFLGLREQRGYGDLMDVAQTEGSGVAGGGQGGQRSEGTGDGQNDQTEMGSSQAGAKKQAGGGTVQAEENEAEDVKKIAITFDDGPHPCYTEQLLDGLKERGVHATFFVTGDCVMILADWQNPVNKRVFVDLVLRKNAGCGVIFA